MDNTVRLWTLLSRQEDGDLSEQEAQELAFLLKDPANKAALDAYHRLEAYWQKLAAQGAKDPALYWEKQKARIMAAEDADVLADTTPISHETGSRAIPWYRLPRVWLAAAAAIALILGVGMIFRQAADNQEQNTIIVVRNGDQKQIVLPDGSKVWLNSGSELSFDKHFSSATHKEVHLKGEAFFDIRHNPDRTFVIHTKYLDIMDLGTRFNVKAYEDEDKMETTLINGSVEVYPKNHPEQMIRLQPNEKVVFDTKLLRSGKLTQGGNASPRSPGLHLDSIERRIGGQSSGLPAGFYVAKLSPKIKSAGDSIVLETAWMQHQLAFSAEPFDELAKNMERWYDVQIDFANENVAGYIFSGIFKEETLQEALDELQMIQPFQYEVRGRSVRIY